MPLLNKTVHAAMILPSVVVFCVFAQAVRPKVEHVELPIYPSRVSGGTTAHIVVEIYLNSDGSVRNAELRSGQVRRSISTAGLDTCDALPLFNASARAAALRWKFADHVLSPLEIEFDFRDGKATAAYSVLSHR